MASRFFGIDRGETKTRVTESASTTSKDIEITIDEAAITNLNEIILALIEIQAFIQEDKRYA